MEPTELETHLLSILERYANANVRPRDRARRVWDLTDPSLSLRATPIDPCKREILRTLVREGETAFLTHHEDPNEQGVPGHWQSTGLRTWNPPRDLDVDEPATGHWLFTLGNWCCYVSASPVLGGWPDPARSSSEALLAWMERTGVQVLVDSFHDDVSWVVALADWSR